MNFKIDKSIRYKDSLLSILLFIVLWEITRRLINVELIPSILEIALQICKDWLFFHKHVGVTLGRVALSLAAGLIIGLTFSLISVYSNWFRKSIIGLNVTLYALPIIILIPIIGIKYSIIEASIIISVLSAFYPIYINTFTGLQLVKLDIINMAKSYGATSFQIIRKVRLKAAVIALFKGVISAIPVSFLCVLLVEYLLGGKGGDIGIGVFLKVAMEQGMTERIWAIAFVITFLVVLSIIGALILEKKISKNTTGVQSLFIPSLEADLENSKNGKIQKRVSYLVSFSLVFILWILVSKTSLLGGPIISKGPYDVFLYLIQILQSDELTLRFITAFASTIKGMVIGFSLGFIIAFLFASILNLYPFWGRLIYPIALLSQAVPIMAYIPLLAIVFGRGFLTIILATISVTFFPAYLTFESGFRASDPLLKQWIKTVGGNRHQFFFRIQIPGAIPYIFEAANLVAPKVLLGIIIAEYLITNTGIGGILYEARGELNFKMLWTLGTLVTILSIVFSRLISITKKIYFSKKHLSMSD